MKMRASPRRVKSGAGGWDMPETNHGRAGFAIVPRGAP